MLKDIIKFSAVELFVLIVGCLGAQVGWVCFHHRYELPASGFYHGCFTAVFENYGERPFTLRINSESSSHWYWSGATNFVYPTVFVEWWDETVPHTATVKMGDFTYESNDGNGSFTLDVLAKWLCGANSPADGANLNAVWKYFEAVAHGSLPPPRHHTHYFDKPIRVRMQHFQVGVGIASTVFAWLPIWALLIYFRGRRLWKKHKLSLASTQFNNGVS